MVVEVIQKRINLFELQKKKKKKKKKFNSDQLHCLK